MKSLILLMLILFSLHLYSKDLECDKLLTYFEIDIKTKGYKGWQRVCNNDKLYLYTKKPINKKDEKDICNCFYYDYKDRDLGIKEK